MIRLSVKHRRISPIEMKTTHKTDQNTLKDKMFYVELKKSILNENLRRNLEAQTPT